MSSSPDWSLAENDPRAFFGLAADATLTDLKRAYARLIKTWKPDMFPLEFKKIRRAFEELEHEFKLEAPQLEFDPLPSRPIPPSERPVPPRPEKAAAPSFDWTSRLHDSGVENTLAEMEKLGRLEPRDWLLLAALREAQNPEAPALFARTLIESLRHHSDDPELWHALLVELRRSWQAREVEALCGELITLHHHPDFLRRCHTFWMHTFEVAPAANLCPLLDRFLHRAHGKAHQEEASFVLEVLMRFGPSLPAEWIRLQTSFYEQIWGPSLQSFAQDLEQLPAIRRELEKSDDPAARRLLDFFAAWGRHDLPGLHLSRQEIRQLLLQRPEKAPPLLSHPDLFLPASRLLSFRSRNLRGGQSLVADRPQALGIRSASADALHGITLLAIPFFGLILWGLTLIFQSTEALPVWMLAIGGLWLYAAPRGGRKIRELWQAGTMLRLIKNFWRANSIVQLCLKVLVPTGLFTFVLLLNCGSSDELGRTLAEHLGFVTLAILFLAGYHRESEICRNLQQALIPPLKITMYAGALAFVIWQTALFLLELSDKAHRWENLGDLIVLLLLLCLLVDPRGLYDSLYYRFARIFEKLFREKTRSRVLASLTLHQVGLLLWHAKLSEAQKKWLRPLMSDGDLHLAAAAWEAPRRRDED
jgi:hypothetical protein